MKKNNKASSPVPETDVDSGNLIERNSDQMLDILEGLENLEAALQANRSKPESMFWIASRLRRDMSELVDGLLPGREASDARE